MREILEDRGSSRAFLQDLCDTGCDLCGPTNAVSGGDDEQKSCKSRESADLA